MTRRKYPREADACRCSHRYEDHVWGFRGEYEPCDIGGCRCTDFKGDGLPADPDRDDRPVIHMAGCDGDHPEWRDA